MIFNKGYFEKVFQQPDPWGHALTGYEKTKYLRQLTLIKKYSPEPKSILEVGCAEGVHTAIMAEVFPEAKILGIDISKNAIMRAKENCKSCPNIELVEADIFKLFRENVLPAKSFDVIVESEFVYYLYAKLLFQFHLVSYFKKTLALLNDTGIFVTSNGIGLKVRPFMEIYYLALKRVGQPVWTASFREWNELRHKHLTYDIRVYRAKT